MDSKPNEISNWLEKPLSTFFPKLSVETLLVAAILIAAVMTRFIDVDARVMSHDETNHVVPAYSLYKGLGYAYDPVTHGPLQFHLLALSYFLLGDSDFSARVPAVLFSIATVAMALLAFRRYLGRNGAIIAGLLMLISPYMLFYGRYTRNEAFGGLWTVLMIYGVLRYLEKGDKSSLFLLTVVMAFHATDKATSFIYNAQTMLFMGLVFLDAALKLNWPGKGQRNRFLTFMTGAVVALVAALGVAALNPGKDETGAVAAPTSAVPNGGSLVEVGLLAVAVILAIAALFLLVRNMGWKAIRQQRSFDLIILAGTLTLPQLASFPMRMLGMNPLDYSTGGMARTTIFLAICTVLAIAIGVWWRPKFWLTAAAIYYSIFTIFFTTFFTNGKGFFMGLVAALGYWLSQQGVQRGSQPLYYYALVHIPIYEYLPVIGLLVAVIIGLRHRLFSQMPGFDPAHQPEKLAVEPVDFDVSVEPSQPELSLDDDDSADAVNGEEPVGEMHLPGWLRATLAGKEELALVAEPPHRVPVLALLVFWSITALVAYSLAGEKMPWLTVHITAAMILGAGWGFGYLVDTTPWKTLIRRRGVLALLLLPVLVASVAGFTSSLLRAPGPFSGNTLEQLTATSDFLMSLVGIGASAAALFYLLSDWTYKNIFRLVLLAIFGFLGFLTARTAFTAAFVHYDEPVEFLVYAHAARGPKDVLAQVEEISKRTTRGLDIVVGYDNETNYPYWWYFRNYPNKRFYGENPGRDLSEAPIIVTGDPNYSKIEPIVKNNYVMFEYMRLWWPMQEYFNLTPERIWNAIVDPRMREAVFNIWLNRDYTQYAQVTGSTSLSLTSWSPAARMRMYVRKDIAAQMWNYGAVPSAAPGEAATDPYEKGMVKLAYERVIGSAGANPGQLNAPRGVAVAPDGSLYVADSRNHRIQHLTGDGKVIQTWGTFADVAKGQAPGGTFNEPWGVAVDVDGSVYVTDTWNHRVQKFSADGKFIKMWGSFGQAERADSFWGPRTIAIDAKGRIFVMDTGNKRVAIFDPEGQGLGSFGTPGLNPGQFDEPVGMAFDRNGNLYVADTWNQRIQVFQPDASGLNFIPMRNWEVSAWFGQSLDNKPFLTVDTGGNVFITDPDSGRVLEFNSDGQFLRGWSELVGDIPALVVPAGLALDAQGGMWVSDASTNHLLHFILPPVLVPAAPALVPQENLVSPTSSLK